MSTTNNWAIDPTHSEIGFSVKHMMFSKVRGTFDEFKAEIAASDDFDNTSIAVEINTNSVNTRNEQRDEHLVGADFFDTSVHPKITFNSTGGNLKTGKIEGEIEVKGVKKSIPLNIDFHGEGKDPWGNTRVAFGFETKINRKDFGLTWNTALETGGVLVGEDVAITGEIQLVKA